MQVFGPHVMDERISDGAYRTLHLLDLLGGADREGHHRLALIANLRNANERTLRRHIEELEGAGLLEVERSRGETNRIYIIEPLDAYGREAIGGFYGEVQRVNRELCSTPPKTTSGKATPDKNVRGTPDKNVRRPRTNLSPHKTLTSDATPKGSKKLRRARKTGADKGVEEKEQSPTGARCDAPEPGEGGKLEESPLKVEGKGRGAAAGWASSAPFVSEGKAQTVCAGGSGKVMPWEREEEAEGLRRKDRMGKKAKVRGLLNPDKKPSEWNGNDLVGYFRDCFKRTFPGEGAPDVRIEDLGAAKRRITWMKNEEMDVAVAKQAVDHLFANWGNGLPSRLRWKGSRPGMALIENARLFETLVREVQSGVPAGGTGDEFTADEDTIAKYQRREEICKRLMDEGKPLAEAKREANRLVGL